ncbi:MAG: RDD family protein [Chitinophagaceae bacterium]|nr:RDD family protein [Chitinophagaceae bacterium]
MSKINISTSFNIDLEFEGAQFHVRMFAWILDFILQVFYLIIVSNLFGLFSGIATSGYDIWAFRWLIMLPVFTYHLFCEILWNGQSVGKRLLGLRVVNDNGGKASLGQYMIRWLLRSSDLTLPLIILAMMFGDMGILKALWITVLMFIADLILIGTTKQGKRLGDLAAGTMLINVKPKGNLEETIFMEVEQSYTAQFPQVMRLSDRDINTIKGIIDTGRKIGNYQMVENASLRIKNVLGIETTLSPFDFLDTLLKDYNYLSTKG